MEIYKDSGIYNSTSIYKSSAGGGGGEDLLYIEKLEWFGVFNIPEETKSYEYTIEERPIYNEYYIGGGAAFPCKNTGGEGLVFATDSLDEVNIIDGLRTRDWSADQWGFSKFYNYNMRNITYPVKVKGVFEIGNFKLYINDVLRFEINSNKIDPDIWNRYRCFYSGPFLNDYIKNKRYLLKDVIFKKQ